MTQRQCVKTIETERASHRIPIFVDKLVYPALYRVRAISVVLDMQSIFSES